MKACKEQAAAKKQMTRAEVPEQEKWDLASVYATTEDWEKAYQKFAPLKDEFARYEGKLAADARNLLKVMQLSGELEKEGGKLFSYASHGFDADTTNQEAAARKARVMQLMAEVAGAAAYIDPEISAIPEAKLREMLAEEPELKAYEQIFDNIIRQAKHQLSAKEETLLAKAGQIFDDPNETYDALSDTDMKFPDIKDDDGNTLQVTHANFISHLEGRNRNIRKQAFESALSSYKQFSNTLAQTLASQVRIHTYNKNIRGFNSDCEAALFSNNIPVAVYDQLIKAVHDGLPQLHRYVALRKKLLGVSELHSYDLYTSLVEGIDLHYTFEEAREIIFKALAPLGEDYGKVLHRAFDERWIDYADNVGKRSGAYSGGSYATHPFILISWQGTLDNLFTLAHELGHSMHSHYTRTMQPVQYGDYCIFLAEIASTTNENLLTEYLLKNATDDKMRLAVINHYLDGFKGTVFRQTQFAEFEKLIHEADENGKPLTSSFLTDTYGELNRKYYGNDLVYDELIGVEWARIPHFYYNFYVFQYATGFSAATAFAKMILNDGPEAVARYLGFLKSGSSAYPIDILKKAGVDMTSEQPILDALSVFERYLDEFEKLV